MIEFSTFSYNKSPLDINARYFHMFSGAQNYLILPLNSVAIDTLLFFDNCRHARPLVESMRYSEDRKGEFRIFSKKDFTFIDQVWETAPYLQVHMIQAFESGDEDGVLYLDTIVAGDGNSINNFYYKVCQITIIGRSSLVLCMTNL